MATCMTKCVCKEGKFKPGRSEKGWINKIKRREGREHSFQMARAVTELVLHAVFPPSAGVMFAELFMCCKVRVVLAQGRPSAPVLKENLPTSHHALVHDLTQGDGQKK